MAAVSHNDGEIVPCDPHTKLPKQAHYASYSECLIYELPPNQSHNAFNPQITEEMASRRTCQHCGHYFVSIKENLFHQKLNLCGWKHQNNQINHHQNMNILHLFDKLSPSQNVENIQKIKTYKLDKNSKNVYLVQYDNEDMEWVHLDDSCLKVKEFLIAHKLLEEEAKANDDMLPRIELHQIPEFLGYDDLSDVAVDVNTDLYSDKPGRRAMERKAARKKERDKEKIWKAPVLKDVHYELGDDHDSNSGSNDSSSSDDNLPIIPKSATKAHNLAKQVYPAFGAGRRKDVAKKAKAAKAKKAKAAKRKKVKLEEIRINDNDGIYIDVFFLFDCVI